MFEINNFAVDFENGIAETSRLKFGKCSRDNFKWSMKRLKSLMKLGAAICGGVGFFHDFLLTKELPDAKLSEFLEEKTKPTTEALKNIDIMLVNFEHKQKLRDDLMEPLNFPQKQSVKTTIVACFADSMSDSQICETFPLTRIAKGTLRSAKELLAETDEFTLYRPLKVIQF